MGGCRAFLLVFVLLGSWAGAAVAAKEVPRARSGEYLVVRPAAGRPLLVHDRPGGHVVRAFARGVFGGPVVAGVVARRGRWLGVTAEQLRNGAVGWVDSRRDDVAVTKVPLALRVDLSARTLEVVGPSGVRRTFRVAIGAGASPTPTGRFAVAEKLAGVRFGPAFGCCILGLTAHQSSPPPGWDSTREWFIGIHGGSGIGGAVSAGCLHLSDSELRYLVAVVPLGAPVFISA